MDSSNSRNHLITEVVGWVVCTFILAGVALNYTELKTHVTRVLSGLPVTAPLKGNRTDLATSELASPSRRSTDGVELTATPSGHYEARVEINGRPLDALVDTGATHVTLRFEDAERAGIRLRAEDFTWVSQTANGQAKAAPVMLSQVSIGNIVVRNVQATVAERGRLNVNLLGMSFLKRLQSFEVRSGRLILKD
jgi:aspartyl protease family protein